MPPRISQLQMTCFRGATKKSSIKFDDKKPIVFLFGENGAGKSTIVDAIDLVTNGSIGSLEKRSVGVSNKTVFLPSVGKALAALSVQLELEGTCPYCREVPARRDGTHFCCTCKKSQLYPLEV